MKKDKSKIDLVFLVLLLLGLFTTLIYIFYSSTKLLTLESLIKDTLAHRKFVNKKAILNHWYYGDDLWLSSFNLPTALLSLFIKNSIISKKIGVFLTAIVFFIILYKYGKKFLSKKSCYILVIIFLTGISYSVFACFYVFSSYLTVVINLMLLLYLYYKSIDEKNNKNIYYIFSLLLTLLLGMGSFKYFLSVTLPFFITELLLNYKDLNYKKIGGLLLTGIVAIIIFCILSSNYKNLSGLPTADFIGFNVSKRIESFQDIVFNFFGYNNAENALSLLFHYQYPTTISKNYSILSMRGIADFIKVLASIIFMIVGPIALYRNYKKNDRKINFLLVFNTLSWLFMLLYYFFFKGFIYSAGNLKFFIFNFIINIILGLYFLYHYFSKFKLYSFVCNVFIISYIICNLYTTTIAIKDNNKMVEKNNELVKLLQNNNLTFFV